MVGPSDNLHPINLICNETFYLVHFLKRICMVMMFERMAFSFIVSVMKKIKHSLSFFYKYIFFENMYSLYFLDEVLRSF